MKRSLIKTDKARPNIFSKWRDKIGACRRVKAVCKPCWEIKYCPYGTLVEQFPLADDNDERCCRIFGHECPTFHVAEPFTETKELRNISRTIPRPVQFRILKRENQICRQCGQSVKDEDIHFDHIIPWSKGGSTEESNIQLLCSKCNRKKGDRFEKNNLIKSFHDHVADTVSVDILDYLFHLSEFCHDFILIKNRLPTADDIAEQLNDGEKTDAELYGAGTIKDLYDFFSGKRPKEISSKAFKALRRRWGFDDRKIHYLKSAADEFGLAYEELLDAEVSLVNRLGWCVLLNKKDKRRWLQS